MEKNFELKNPLVHGLKSNNDELKQSHPLEISEKNYEMNRTRGQMRELRNLQGLHAPLRLQMERQAVSRVGHLPIISSRSGLGNPSLEVLNDTDSTIGFNDIFGKLENFEGFSSVPSMVIEKSLGML